MGLIGFNGRFNRILQHVDMPNAKHTLSAPTHAQPAVAVKTYTLLTELAAGAMLVCA